ncbi:13008_t:CDS:2, partial [Entrophospora sp. SA101]
FKGRTSVCGIEGLGSIPEILAISIEVLNLNVKTLALNLKGLIIFECRKTLRLKSSHFYWVYVPP